MNVKTFDSALGFAPAKTRTGGTWEVLRKSFDAIREGITLAGDYKELTNRGVAPSEAARKVFEQIGKV